MTAIHAHADGHWLRVGSPVRAHGGHAPRARAPRLLTGVAVVVAVLGAAAIVGNALVGTPDNATSLGSAAPASARVEAVPVVTAPTPPTELAASFERWSDEYGVPVTLLEALTWHESRWQPQVVSEAGAIGLGQLMPATAAAVEAAIGEDLDPWQVDDNVRMAAHLLGTLLTSAGGDARVALAGYAQGASSVARDGMTPATRQYVEEILVLHDLFGRAG